MSFKEAIEKITSSRVFTVVLCLVLCASLLFSYGTTQVQAIAIADDIAIGILALLILATAGVVIHVNNQNQIGAVGNSFKTSMYQWGTSAEKLDEVDEFFGGLTLYNPGGSDDGDEDPRREVRLARGILTGIATWIVSICFSRKIDDTAHAQYIDFPDFSSLVEKYAASRPYITIALTGSSSYYLDFSPIPRYASSSSSYLKYQQTDIDSSSLNYVRYYLSSDGSEWKYSASSNLSTDANYSRKIVWSSYDITWIEDGSIYFPAGYAWDHLEVSNIISDLPNQIVAGEKDEDDIILPDVIDYGAIIQDGMTLEDSVIDTLGQLSTGALDYNQFVHDTVAAESPVFIQNLPLTPTMSFEYAVGEKADTFTVQATANGTLLYEWLDTSTTPYTVLGTGQSFTPDTSRPATYPLVCRVRNTIPCSFVSTGYVTNTSYSWTYYISVVGETVDPPASGETEPSSPGTTYPNYSEQFGDLQQGLDNINQGISSLPGQMTDSLQGVLDQESADAQNAGQEYVDQLTGMIPNDSQGFVDAMGALADSLGYTGTECVLPIPALKLPALAGLFPSYTVMQAQEVDFEEMIGMLPPNLLLLVRSLLTIALIAYCFKELYSTFSYFFVLKGGKA